MTITGGRTPSGGDPAGGGILSDDADLTLTDTVITGNVADNKPLDGSEGFGFGGGVAFVDGSLTVSDSVISGNIAGQDGDGVASSYGLGGGIFALGAEVLIENSTISENKALGTRPNLGYPGGGGVALSTSGNLTIQGSTISGNIAGNTGSNGSEVAYGSGGGVFFDAFDQLIIQESTISGNVAGNTGTSDGATARGGGVMSNGNTLVQTSTISGNTAGATDGTEGLAVGGGLLAYNSLTVFNSTIVGNQAIVDGTPRGGGIAGGGAPGPTIEMHNTIVAGNTADVGPDLAGDLLVNYSVIEDPSGHNITNAPVMLINGSPNLGPLAANGGPTETHALTQASPAFNTGDLSNCPATDQRGVPRPQFGQCDIGAFELAGPLEGLLELFDDAVDDGDLEGVGNGNSAANRLNTFRHWLDNAQKLFEGGNVEGACTQLQSALDRTDGVAPPPDFVEGDAADDMAAAIAAAQATIGCE